MPEGAVVVARPSRWGNPFIVLHDQGRWAVWLNGTLNKWPAGNREGAQLLAVQLFRDACLTGQVNGAGYGQLHPASIATLRGRSLCCWCPLDQPCHADVLLELANAPLRCEAADE